jgi:hypothetical protein
MMSVVLCWLLGGYFWGDQSMSASVSVPDDSRDGASGGVSSGGVSGGDGSSDYAVDRTCELGVECEVECDGECEVESEARVDCHRVSGRLAFVNPGFIQTTVTQAIAFANNAASERGEFTPGGEFGESIERHLDPSHLRAFRSACDFLTEYFNGARGALSRENRSYSEWADRAERSDHAGS